MFNFLKTRAKKWVTIGSVAIFLSVQALSFLLVNNVYAQVAPTPQLTIVTRDIPRDGENIKRGLWDSLKLSAISGAMNAVTFFVQKLAYDTAVFVASGGKGQNSLIFQQGFGDYLLETLGDTVGELVHQLGEPFGLNLCGFPDINLQLFIQLGIRDLHGSGPQSNCSWKDFKDGWSEEAFVNKYGKDGSKLLPEKFSDVLSVKNSDFGVAFGAIGKIDQLAAGVVGGAQAERLEGEGIKAVKDLISGKIGTPASNVQLELEALSPQKRASQSVDQIGDLYAAEIPQLLPMAAGVFLNTLASQLLKQAFTKGIVPTDGDFSPNAFGIVRKNRAAAQSAFTYLLTPVVGRGDLYNIVTQFSSCPFNPAFDNCVIDQKFASAINRANQGTPLTLQQAIDAGLIDGNKPLYSPRREADNTDTNCWQNGFCYSNIQKLRKARILPLGFEIAALKADPDQPQRWTLQTVINGFHSCAANGLPDSQFPFCRLINPNWVLKSPQARCTALVTGPSLLGEAGPTRRQECVDYETCLNTAPNGSCLDDAFGFCTKEENTWSFARDNSCPAEFATCQSYSDSEGKVVSYLARTLDFGQCSDSDVGCRAYSLEQPNGVWRSSANINSNLKTLSLGRNQVVNLNGNVLANTCPTNAEGCSAFYPAQKNTLGQYIRTQATPPLFQKDRAAQPVYLKKAPDYLGCYDADNTTSVINWPQNLADLNTGISQNEACKKFANACIASEVGCQGYTLVKDAGAPEIPGVIGANACSQQCVGYAAYRQQKEAFEPESANLVYMIPENGSQCAPQYSGCEEFTNLEETVLGGEGLEYYTKIRYCEKPTQQNNQAYFSWEGSITEGFTLKTHRLIPVDQARFDFISSLQGLNLPGSSVVNEFPVGSPAYVEDTRTALEDNYFLCNETRYNLRINGTGTAANPAAPLNCVAIIDNQGANFYRLIDQTIASSATCNRLRKTNPVLFVDGDLTNITTTDPQLVGGLNRCQQRGGLWGPALAGGADVCQRCMGGGVYNNGDCVYSADTNDFGTSSCPASANQCRQYVGNTGSNIHEVFEDEFEPLVNEPAALLAARQGWSATPLPGDFNVASESLIPGKYSLRVGATVQNLERALPANTLKSGSSYQLTFWARGVPQTIQAQFFQGTTARGDFNLNVTTNQTDVSGIGITWRQYAIGPVQFTGDTALESVIRFTRGQIRDQALGDYFIDNVRLLEVQDQVYLIKNSWKTPEGYDAPEACDANPTDGRPGAALGCVEYKDRGGNPAFATGFERLCRPGAIGCEPFYDTFNTVSTLNIGSITNAAELPQAYNVWCVGAPGRDCTITVAQEDYTCRVAAANTGCYITDRAVIVPPGTQLPQNAQIRPSTILVPGDTPSDTPIFLARVPQFECQPGEQGCTKVGEETNILPGRTDDSAFSYRDYWYRNNPDEYFNSLGGLGVLCTSEAVGCQQFTAGQSTAFFKDPKVTGGATCSYQPQVNIGGQQYKGWFLDGVGTCTGTPANNPPQTCRVDADCGVGNTCPSSSIGTVACYANLLSQTPSGLVYDIRSNGSTGYAGRSGICEAKYNLCTEFVDRADVSIEEPGGKAYYALFNDDLTGKIEECGGKASLNEGCVLFDQTNNPNKIYNSSITYRQSENATPPFSAVDPVSGGANFSNDSNIVLKVDRDRQCAEWLQCKSSIEQAQADGKVKKLCYDYRACNQRDGQDCSNWVGQNEYSLARLNEDTYVRRGISWYDRELSGYSMFKNFQINDLYYVNFDFSGLLNLSQPDQQALLPLTRSLYAVYVRDTSRAECLPTVASGPSRNWDICGPDNGGRCYGEQCIYPVDRNFPTNVHDTRVGPIPPPTKADLELLILGSLTGASCKAFPEQDSPFPDKIAPDPNQEANRPGLGTVSTQSRKEFQNKKDGFENANVCQDGNCSCGYQKNIYTSGIIDYLPTPVNSASIVTGICSFGDYKGRPCALNSSDCGIGVTCQPLERKETHVGLEGLCLEKDFSRPINGLPGQNEGPQDYACLTWLPIDVSASTIDIFNTHLQAGYFPDLDARLTPTSPANGKLYCVDAIPTGRGVVPSTSIYPPESVAQNESTFFSSGNTQSQGYFLNDNPTTPNGRLGMPNLGITNRNCGANIPYVNFVCDPNFGLELSYQVMQTWAWRMIGGNATVLRIEKKPDFTDISEDNWLGVTFGTIGGTATLGRVRGGSNVASVHHFAPVPTSRGYIAGGVFGYGTVMHPPRLFNAPMSEPDRQLLRESIPYAMTGDEPSVRTFIQAPSYSPELAWNNNLLVSRYVHKYATEQTINERDIDRLYIVTTANPNGHGGATPELMTPDLYIDFTKLNTSPETGGNSRVSALMHEALVLGPGDVLPNASIFPYGNNSYKFTAAGWTYKQSRAPGSYIGNYFDYPVPLSSLPSNLGIDVARNEVQSRYVAVFVTDVVNGVNTTQHPSWVPALPGFVGEISPTAPDNARVDPFEQLCSVSRTALQENWFAIGLDFNADGEFLGYISKWCNSTETDSDGDDDAVQFAIVATLKSQCTDIAEVYSEANAADPNTGSNKAWTNRTWQHGTEESIPPLIANQKSISNSPFASLRDIGGAGFGDQRAMRRYTFSYPTLASSGALNVADGAPYACGETTWHSFPILGRAVRSCSALNSQERLRTPYQYDGGLVDAISGDIANPRTINHARATLSQLFAKIYRLARYNNNNPLENLTANPPANSPALFVIDGVNDDPTLDQSGPNGPGASLSGPVIYSLNPARCGRQTSVPGQPCTAAVANSFSINGKTNTMIDFDGDTNPDEDENGDGNPDPLIGIGTFSAFVQFFAHADDNRMPIRRVLMNWGEGSSNSILTQNGFYKNHKPLCSTEDSPLITVGLCGEGRTLLTGMTCKQPTDCSYGARGGQLSCFFNGQNNTLPAPASYVNARFGNSPRACEDKPFQFRHDYTCSRQDVEAYQRNPATVPHVTTPALAVANGTLTNPDAINRLRAVYNVGDNDPICIFKPRVQVKDNWGYCNGVTAAGDNTSYYSEGATDECRSGRVTAYTPYSGEVIVIPIRRGN